MRSKYSNLLSWSNDTDRIVPDFLVDLVQLDLQIIFTYVVSTNHPEISLASTSDPVYQIVTR